MKPCTLGISTIVLAVVALSSVSAVSNDEPRRAPCRPVYRMVFGSCANQNKPHPFWKHFLTRQPDVALLLGDNVYADTLNASEMAVAYQSLAAKPDFQRVQDEIDIMSVWDDHDFGINDIGGMDNPIKHEARQLHLDFFRVPLDSPRRTRASGIYTSRIVGTGNERVQIIVLDTRWGRDQLDAVDTSLHAELEDNGVGPYEIVSNTSAQLLWEEQWEWLSNELDKEADVRVLCSSIVVLPSHNGWETWANFPHERRRLFELLRKKQPNGLLLLTGDLHWAEVSEVHDVLPYPLMEFTSSGLTETWHILSNNSARTAVFGNVANFGQVDVDWQTREITVSFHRSDTGAPFYARKLSIDMMKGGTQ